MTTAQVREGRGGCKPMPLEREHMIMAALPCWTWQGPFPGCGGVGGTGESVDEQEEQEEQADGHCGMRPHKRRSVRVRSSCAGPKQASEFLGESAACCVVAEPSRAGVKKTHQKPKPSAASAEPLHVDVKKKQQTPPAAVPVSVSSGDNCKWWKHETHEDWRCGWCAPHPSPLRSQDHQLYSTSVPITTTTV